MVCLVSLVSNHNACVTVRWQACIRGCQRYRPRGCSGALFLLLLGEGMVVTETPVPWIMYWGDSPASSALCQNLHHTGRCRHSNSHHPIIFLDPNVCLTLARQRIACRLVFAF
jgi:hypothetical protein